MQKLLLLSLAFSVSAFGADPAKTSDLAHYFPKVCAITQDSPFDPSYFTKFLPKETRLYITKVLDGTSGRSGRSEPEWMKFFCDRYMNLPDCEVLFIVGPVTGKFLNGSTPSLPIDELERLSCSAPCQPFEKLKEIYFFGMAPGSSSLQPAIQNRMNAVFKPADKVRWIPLEDFSKASVTKIDEYLEKNFSKRPNLHKELWELDARRAVENGKKAVDAVKTGTSAADNCGLAASSASPAAADRCKLYQERVPTSSKIAAMKTLLSSAKAAELAESIPSTLYFLKTLPEKEREEALKEIANIPGLRKKLESASATAKELSEKRTWIETQLRLGVVDQAKHDEDYAKLFLKALQPIPSEKRLEELCRISARENPKVKLAEIPDPLFSDVKGIAAIGCLRPDDAGIQARLAKIAQGPDSAKAKAALLALAGSKVTDEGALLALVKALSLSDADVLKATTDALLKNQNLPESVLKELRNILDFGSAAQKIQAVRILFASSKLSDQDKTIVLKTAMKIYPSAPDEMGEVLLSLGKDDPAVEKQLVEYLDLKDSTTHEKVMRLLNDFQPTDPAVQLAAAKRYLAEQSERNSSDFYFFHFDTPEAVDFLIDAVLKDPSAEKYTQAGQKLSRVHHLLIRPEQVEQLMKVVSGNGPRSRKYAALNALHSSAWPKLYLPPRHQVRIAKLLESTDGALSRNAIEILSAFGGQSKELFAELKRIFEEGSLDAKKNAVEVFVGRGDLDAETVKMLLPLFSIEDIRLQNRLVGIFQNVVFDKLRKKELIPHLKEITDHLASLADHEDSYLAQSAQNALGYLQPKDSASYQALCKEAYEKATDPKNDAFLREEYLSRLARLVPRNNKEQMLRLVEAVKNDELWSIPGAPWTESDTPESAALREKLASSAADTSLPLARRITLLDALRDGRPKDASIQRKIAPIINESGGPSISRVAPALYGSSLTDPAVQKEINTYWDNLKKNRKNLIEQTFNLQPLMDVIAKSANPPDDFFEMAAQLSEDESRDIARAGIRALGNKAFPNEKVDPILLRFIAKRPSDDLYGVLEVLKARDSASPEIATALIEALEKKPQSYGGDIFLDFIRKSGIKGPRVTQVISRQLRHSTYFSQEAENAVAFIREIGGESDPETLRRMKLYAPWAFPRN